MQVQNGADTVWVSTASYLVFTMVLGFALLETGLVRKKNHDAIALQNLLASVVCGFWWWILGYNFAFGSDNNNINNGFIGWDQELVVTNGLSVLAYQVHWVFQWGFADTAVTIPSGSVAERLPILGYVVYLSFLSTIIYPIPCHWIWGANGWLKLKGVHDFAGTMAVHLVGGFSGLIACLWIGPRRGRFVTGKTGGIEAQKRQQNIEREFAPHNTGYVLIGTLMLWFGWYGFNCGSTHSAKDNASLIIGLVGLNTTLGSVGGGLGMYFIGVWRKDSIRNQLINTCTGILGGLISVTGCCDTIEQWAAIIIGLGSAFVYNFISQLLKKIGIDDACDASPLHFGVGLYAIIMTAFFANGNTAKGVFYGDGKLLGWNIVGILAVGAWVAATTSIAMLFLKTFDLLRLSEQEELVGMDFFLDYQEDEEIQPLKIDKKFNPAQNGESRSEINIEMEIENNNNNNKEEDNLNQIPLN